VISDTTPVPPPDPPTRPSNGPPLAPELNAAAFDALREEVAGMRAELAARHTERPAWVDDVLAAVTSITPSKAVASEVVALRERLNSFDERCEGRHERELPRLTVPPNGGG
jgi:hypothetical protein